MNCRRHHPYRKVGVQTVQDALSLFDDAVPTYEGEHSDTNVLRPNNGGDQTDESYGPEPSPVWPATLASAAGRHRRHCRLRGSTSRHPTRGRCHSMSAARPSGSRATCARTRRSRGTKTARHQQRGGSSRSNGPGPRGARPAREPVAERRAGRLPGDSRRRQPRCVRDALGDHLGVDVFEVPMGPPSLPGLRLEDALFSALDEAGASIETGNPVVDFDGEDRIEKVFIEKNGAKIPNSATRRSRDRWLRRQGRRIRPRGRVRTGVRLPHPPRRGPLRLVRG